MRLSRDHRILTDFIFSSDDSDSWFYEKYYYGGSNSRYWTFQLALNLLLQTRDHPIIVETGCQRMKDDLGGGMSSSIFGEFNQRYGGRTYSVDIVAEHLNTCKECTVEFSESMEYVLSDSVAWLGKEHKFEADLLYLDSLDHPYGEMLNHYGGQHDIEGAMKKLASMSQEEVLQRHGDLVAPCQKHCLMEFMAAKRSGLVTENTILLVDDNQLPGGGKSRMLKDYLLETGEWICLFDLQQTLWVRK